MKINFKLIAFLFFSIILVGCASIFERMDAIAIPVESEKVEALETPVFGDGRLRQSILYKGGLYGRSKTAGKPPLTADRFTPVNPGYTDIKYIDVIYFGGKPSSYVIVAKPDLLKTDKHNMVNYTLTDTDCDGAVDVKTSAGGDDLLIAVCFAELWKW